MELLDADTEGERLRLRESVPPLTDKVALRVRLLVAVSPGVRVADCV